MFTHSDSQNDSVFKLGDLGEGVVEATLLRWYVKPGDNIKDDEKLCEVQTEDASVNINAQFDGTITQLCYQEGEVASVGKPLVHYIPPPPKLNQKTDSN